MTAAIEARPGRPRREDALTCLLGDDVLEGRPREYREDSVVEGEEEEEAHRIGRYGGSHAADDERDREREHEERKQDLAGAPRCRHCRHEGADGERFLLFLLLYDAVFAVLSWASFEYVVTE